MSLNPSDEIANRKKNETEIHVSIIRAQNMCGSYMAACINIHTMATKFSFHICSPYRVGLKSTQWTEGRRQIE